MPTFRTSRPVSAADPGKPHLILAGLPGAGKSTVGTALADALGRTFLDFDLEISRRQGMSIQEIFGQRGEQHFRDLEHALTEELRELGNMVLAPGGGWMGRPDTVALLRPPATVVYLKVTPATAVRRMGTGVGTRPLLRHPNPVAELERLLGLRRAAYESADIVLDVERLTSQQVTQKLLERLGAGPAGTGA
jgi:shikimate kinase